MRPGPSTSALQVVSQDSDDDEQAIARIATGDADALGELYDRYARIVYGVALRIVGNPAAAEEVAQDVFHVVWRRAGTYRRERGSFRTWLLSVARNAAIDWRRTKGRHAGDETSMDELPLAADLNVEERVIRNSRAEEVRMAVEALPPETREALALAYWLGLSQSEIARRTGTPLGTVKTRMRTGMQKLRVQLSAEAQQ